MKKNKLFIVECGEPDGGRDVFSLKTEPSIFVIAEDFNSAADKALLYLEAKQKETKQSVLDGDGSLNKDIIENKEIKVKTVRYAGDVIW